jgi:hypothetical protein
MSFNVTIVNTTMLEPILLNDYLKLEIPFSEVASEPFGSKRTRKP